MGFEFRKSPLVGATMLAAVSADAASAQEKYGTSNDAEATIEQLAQKPISSYEEAISVFNTNLQLLTGLEAALKSWSKSDTFIRESQREKWSQQLVLIEKGLNTAINEAVTRGALEGKLEAEITQALNPFVDAVGTIQELKRTIEAMKGEEV